MSKHTKIQINFKIYLTNKSKLLFFDTIMQIKIQIKINIDCFSSSFILIKIKLLQFIVGLIYTLSKQN